MVFLLLVAGHETTVNLIASGTLALVEQPDQQRRLCHDPSLTQSTIRSGQAGLGLAPYLNRSAPYHCPYIERTPTSGGHFSTYSTARAFEIRRQLTESSN